MEKKTTVDVGEIMSAFDPEELPINSICVELAEERSREILEARNRFLKWLEGAGCPKEFEDFESEIIHPLTNNFTDAAFAVGFIFGQNCRLKAKKAIAAAAELEELLIEEEILPGSFT